MKILFDAVQDTQTLHINKGIRVDLSVDYKHLVVWRFNVYVFTWKCGISDVCES